MARIKKKYRLMPLYSLDGNWTKVCNTMIFYIPDAYAFKIYVYLCYRYNDQYDYAFPSLNTIAKDTSISKRKVQESIKWLEQKKFIVKYKRKGDEWMNNCYYVRYVIEDKVEEQREIVNAIEKEILEEYEKEIEVEVIMDEDGNIIEEEISE